MVQGEIRRRKNKTSQDGESSSTDVPRSPTPTSASVHKKLGRDAKSSTVPPLIQRILSGKYDEYAWFVVFLTALVYFIVTRSGGGLNNNRGGLLSSLSKPYEVVVSSVNVGGSDEDEELVKSIFYIAKSKSTQRRLSGDGTTSFNSLTLAPNCRLEIILSSPIDVYHKTSAANGGDDLSGECTTPTISSQPFLSHLLSSTWVHDAELGRGYLLLADAGRSGRIWRWEVGGGPITIGRSLYMERSGCRSGLWVDDAYDSRCPENLFGRTTAVKQRKLEAQSACSNSEGDIKTTSLPPLLGSASLAVEVTRNSERASCGKNIVISEWGERRIIRVEGETGARTPLVTLVPETSQSDAPMRRVYRPQHLTYTPFGDLIFSDSYESSRNHGRVGTVYRLREAVHVKPITVDQSRDAHGWTGTAGDSDIDENKLEIVFQTSGWVDGMTLGGSDFSTLYISVVVPAGSDVTSFGDWTKTIHKLTLNADDDDDEEDCTGSEDAIMPGETTILYSVSSNECQNQDIIFSDPVSFLGSKLTVDEKGTLYTVACPASVILLSKDDGRVVGNMSLNQLAQSTNTPTPNTSFNEVTSINFGEDGYLYMSTPNTLMRIKSRVKGASMPTNLVVPPPLK